MSDTNDEREALAWSAFLADEHGTAFRLFLRLALDGSAEAQRQVGLMRTRLRVAGWALDGALATVGDDPTPSMDTVVDVMAAKREIALAGVEVCDLAMDVAGGSAFFKGSVVERCYRDIRAVKFHPLTPEDTLVHAGRLELGLPVDER